VGSGEAGEDFPGLRYSDYDKPSIQFNLCQAVQVCSAFLRNPYFRQD
jgi:hypothetical protein